MFFSEKAGRLPINSVSDGPVKDGVWAGYGLLRGYLCDGCFCVELLRFFGESVPWYRFPKIKVFNFYAREGGTRAASVRHLKQG